MHYPRHYYRPASLIEAVEIAVQTGGLAIAGGSAALGRLEFPFETLIDLQGIPELSMIEASINGWQVGAACLLQDLVEQDFPAVIKLGLTRTIALNQRNSTSVGESLLFPQRFGEWIAVLVALDAGIRRVAPGKDLTGSITETGLVEGGDRRLLERGVLTAVVIPALANGETLGLASVSRTPADIPIVCAAVFVRLNGSGVVETAFAALHGISETPVVNRHIESLVGSRLNEQTIVRAVDGLNLNVQYEDYRGSAEYRHEMARLCVRRALEDCRKQDLARV